MEGQKDEARVRYEREIRVGMLLLGVLAVAFISVVARRIWVENRATASVTKKPIYLSKVERDAIRRRVKPLPLNSIYANSPQTNGEPKKIPEIQRREPIAGNAADPIPDLEISESEADQSEDQSRVANYEDREDSFADARPPAALPTATRSNPIDSSQGSRLSRNEDRSQAGLPQRQVEEAISPDEKHKREEPSDSEPANDLESVSPSPLEHAASVTQDTAKELPKAIEAPSNTAVNPIVRKKVENNPWKRSPPSAPKALARRYTVEQGDSLKSIAKNLLNDESRWREIYDLNRDEIGDDFEYLQSGIRLRLPSVSDEPPDVKKSNSEDSKIPGSK